MDHSETFQKTGKSGLKTTISEQPTENDFLNKMDFFLFL